MMFVKAIREPGNAKVLHEGDGNDRQQPKKQKNVDGHKSEVLERQNADNTLARKRSDCFAAPGRSRNVERSAPRDLSGPLVEG
jgi:hypothetical protein